MVLLNWVKAARWAQQHRAPDDYNPRIHLTAEELRQRFAPSRMRPTETIDYAAEVGAAWPAWPKKLKVDPVTHTGATVHLLRAVYGADAVPDGRRRVRLGRVDAMGNEHAGDFDDFPLACPAWRVMGRGNIARWLGVTPAEVPRLKDDFPGVIHKIGKLLVADAERLNDLWVWKARRTSAARSRANAARRSRGSR